MLELPKIGNEKFKDDIKNEIIIKFQTYGCQPFVIGVQRNEVIRLVHSKIYQHFRAQHVDADFILSSPIDEHHLRITYAGKVLEESLTWSDYDLDPTVPLSFTMSSYRSSSINVVCKSNNGLEFKVNMSIESLENIGALKKVLDEITGKKCKSLIKRKLVKKIDHGSFFELANNDLIPWADLYAEFNEPIIKIFLPLHNSIISENDYYKINADVVDLPPIVYHSSVQENDCLLDENRVVHENPSNSNSFPTTNFMIVGSMVGGVCRAVFNEHMSSLSGALSARNPGLTSVDFLVGGAVAGAIVKFNIDLVHNYYSTKVQASNHDVKNL